MREVCSFTDYLIVCSADSDRQIKAIKEAVDTSLSETGLLPHHIEGDGASGWILMDYGSIIAHIFDKVTREYYQLDELWGRAPLIVRIQ